MWPEVQSLTQAVADGRPLEITLRAYEGDGYAALGLDLRGLDAVLIAAGIAEVSTAYLNHVLEGATPGPYSPNSLSEFGAMLSREFAQPAPEPARLAQGDRWLNVFRSQIDRRRGGFWSVGDGEILRVELVALSKENPTVTKIIATSFGVATFSLAATFGAVQMMQERGAAQCRQEIEMLSLKHTELIMKQAKLEGRFTQNHEQFTRTVHQTMSAEIAACGSSMNSIHISVGHGGIDLRIDGPKRWDTRP